MGGVFEKLPYAKTAPSDSTKSLNQIEGGPLASAVQNCLVLVNMYGR